MNPVPAQMGQLRQDLSHVLWIGGATDAGKSTVALLLARCHGLQLYNYDRTDLPHHQLLAERSEEYRRFLDATLEENWVLSQPETLVQRAIQSFRDRWPLVINDLLALSRDTIVLAEGFGLLPELVAPMIESKHQAIWLVPSYDFKLASMKRRNKPSFASKTSDPERARDNLLKRDMLLAENVKLQAQAYGQAIYEVNGTRSAEEFATMLEEYFGPLLYKS